ncbi:MAG: DUF4352 domain-containing protein [Candidatus Acidiferrales bacterium]
MAETTPHLAPIVVLLFLGAVFVTGVSFLFLFYGAARRSKLYARIGGGVALTVVACYALLLCGVSLASTEKVLPAGGWKYFCEIDCHIGYSVSGVETAGSIGPEMRQTSARGQFVIVRLKVWFDEHTISPNRGDGPLTPNARRVVLVDVNGRAYAQTPEGEAELARVNGDAGSLRQPLRPGQSFAKDLVFDVPKDASGLRLLITEDDPETLLIIGHENSLLHKKIYLGLDPAPTITLEISALAPNN